MDTRGFGGSAAVCRLKSCGNYGVFWPEEEASRMGFAGELSAANFSANCPGAGWVIPPTLLR